MSECPNPGWLNFFNHKATSNFFVHKILVRMSQISQSDPSSNFDDATRDHCVLKGFSEGVKADSHLKNLPTELLIRICLLLPVKDLVELGCSTKHFLGLLHDNWLYVLKCRKERFSPVKRKRVGNVDEYYAILLASSRRKSSLKAIPRLHHFGEAPWKTVYREQFVINNVNWKTGRYNAFVCESRENGEFHLYFDDDRAASISMPNLSLWDWSTGSAIVNVPLHDLNRHVTATRFNRHVVISGFSDGSIIVFSAIDGSILASKIVHHCAVSSLTLDKSFIAVGFSDGTIILLQYTRPPQTSFIVPFKPIFGHTDCVSSLQWQDQCLISVGMDGKLSKWSNDSQVIIQQDCGAIFCMQASRDFIVFGCNDFTIRVCDFQTLKTLHVLTGHTDPVISVHFDSWRIVSGGLDRTIKIWDGKTLKGKPVSLSPREMEGNVLMALRTNKTQIISSMFNPASGREKLIVLDFSMETW